MKADGDTLNNNSYLRGIAVRHAQLRHPVQRRTSDQRLRRLPFKPSCAHALSAQYLHAEHGCLGEAPPVIAHFLLPLLSSVRANPAQVLVANMSLLFAVAMLPDVRPLLRGDGCPRSACPYRLIAVALVVCL